MGEEKQEHEEVRHEILYVQTPMEFSSGDQTSGSDIRHLRWKQIPMFQGFSIVTYKEMTVYLVWIAYHESSPSFLHNGITKCACCLLDIDLF